jgi:hypothetical protein
LGFLIHLTDGKDFWMATRHQLGVEYAPGGSDQSSFGEFQFVVHRDVLTKYLNRLAPLIKCDPTEPHPVVTNPDPNDAGLLPVPAHIVRGQPGLTLEIEPTADRIKTAIESDPTTSRIWLFVKFKAPKLSRSDLAGIDSRLGYFVTHFNPGDVGRTMTVRHAIDLIDGTVVKPGAIFSVNETVGERTPAHGFFGKGHVFIDGKMEIQAGGGMCQVATTLFNAAMIADLKIVQRFQHVRTVPYVDPGRDATVYWGKKDFKIRNNTNAPLYISYHTTYSRAVVALFGKAVPGRKVKLVNYFHQLAERHFTGVFYRIVYGPDGKGHRDKTFYSDYIWTPALDFTR